MSTKNLIRGVPTLLFLLGFGLFLFTRRSELVPLIPAAIFVAPVFILRFCRTQSARRGILLTLAGFVLSMNIALWGLFDIGQSWQTVAFNIVRSSLLAVLYFLPYLIDRLVHPEIAW